MNSGAPEGLAVPAPLVTPVVLPLNEPICLWSYSLMLLNGDKEYTNVIVYDLTGPGLESMIYHTRGEHVNHHISFL